MHQINRLLSFFLLMAIGSCKNDLSKHTLTNGNNPQQLLLSQSEELQFETLFTSGINKGKAINNLSEIPLSFNRVYLFINWKKISEGNHTLRWKVLNDKKELHFDHSTDFNYKANDTDSWVWYDFNHHSDKPGNWVFQIWLDGNQIISAPFKVLSFEEASRKNKADWLTDNFFLPFKRKDTVANNVLEDDWKVKVLYQSPLPNDEIGCVRVLPFNNYLRVFFLKETETGAELYEAFRNGFAKFIDDIFISVYDPLNNTNFIGKDKKLYYFTDNKKQETFYFDLENNTIKSIPSSNEIFSINPFLSKDSSYALEKNCRAAHISLKYIKSDKKEFVTSLKCLGNFGSLSWDINNSVYFDLGHSQGGIWEYNAPKKTLNQIIYAQKVMHPFSLMINNTPFVVFANRGCIKVATHSSFEEFNDDFDPFNASILSSKSYIGKGSPRLKLNLQKSKTYVLSYANEIAGGDTINIYQIGKINNTALNGGILYRADIVKTKESLPVHGSMRFVKKDNKIYILKNASSETVGKHLGSNQISFKDPYYILTKKNFITTEDTILMDGYHRIDEFTIPGKLTVNNHPAHLNFRQEIPVEHLKKVLNKEPMKAFAAVPGASLPEIFYTNDSLKQFNGAFWVFRKDSTALIFEMNYNFRKTFFEKKMADFTHFTASPPSSGPYQYANIIPSDKVNLKEFYSIGKTAYNDSLYFPKNFNHSIIKSTYDTYAKLKVSIEEKDSTALVYEVLPYHQFCDDYPLFLWKDPVGRFVQFTNTKFTLKGMLMEQENKKTKAAQITP